MDGQWIHCCRNRCIAMEQSFCDSWYGPLVVCATAGGVNHASRCRLLWVYATAGGVDHASWCRPLWVHATADGVDHASWCRPLWVYRMAGHFCYPSLRKLSHLKFIYFTKYSFVLWMERENYIVESIMLNRLCFFNILI